MDLSNPLASIMPANDALVFRVLARLESPVSGRQVHKLAGYSSYSGVRLALERLTTTGIVHAQRLEHATLFSINRDHLLWPCLDEIMVSRLQLMRMIRGYLNYPVEFASPDGQLSVSFYGSVARCDSSQSSDVDLAVVYATTDLRRELKSTVLQVADQIELWTGNPCQMYDITRTELKHMVTVEDPLVASWSQDAVAILGPSMQTLIRDARL